MRPHATDDIKRTGRLGSSALAALIHHATADRVRETMLTLPLTVQASARGRGPSLLRARCGSASSGPETAPAAVDNDTSSAGSSASVRRAAVVELMRAHGDAVLGFCVRVLGEPELAEESGSRPSSRRSATSIASRSGRRDAPGCSGSRATGVWTRSEAGNGTRNGSTMMNRR